MTTHLLRWVQRWRITIVAYTGGMLIGVLLPWIFAALISEQVARATASTSAAFAGVALALALLQKRVSSGGQLAKQVSRDVDGFMIGGAEVSHFVDSVKTMIQKDVAAASDISARADEIAAATVVIAADAENAAIVAANVHRESAVGQTEIERGVAKMKDARQHADAAARVMATLQEKSEEIHDITRVIDAIATQTNLLALNAAIEAARAGAHGRGFAVVAGEVRQLAQRTKSATDDSANMLAAISDEAQRAASSMTTLVAEVSTGASYVEGVHASIGKIGRASAESATEIKKILLATREHAAATKGIAAATDAMRARLHATQEELPQISATAMALVSLAEGFFNVTEAFQLRSHHDDVRTAAKRAARDVESVFTESMRTGEIGLDDLFDHDYRVIPHTNPAKYSTRFDAFTDRVLPTIQEAILTAHPAFIYAGAVDVNGYFPTHNARFSRTLIGNHEIDLVNNRTKRIFDDRTGRRCGANTNPFLLQTYKRDTGEVMHDLSVPIYLAGKHWGGFRIGYRSAADTVTSLVSEAADPAPREPAVARKVA